ncbi:MAG TPA: chromate efflux transporter, partial [Gemmatimonadaceae bacterium]|nr:chromate efflux transporter [Gemmatimonadaceae bacterium]
MAAASRLPELALVFLKLGTIAFGGPAVHVAMMEDEVVRRRGWLSRERFLDYVGASNLIPGPNSTELAIHIGRERAGWPGLVVAGTCFILPAFLIVWTIAWAYVRWGQLPRAQAVLYGVQPVVIAVVAQALWRLGRGAVTNWRLALLGAAAAGAVLAGVDELLVLLLGGLAALALRHAPGAAAGAALPLLPAIPAIPAVSAASPGALFLVFAKIGSVLFGSGYVLLAFLRSELVVGRGWLTERQLLDAVAVGQVTPGPVFTTATFVGYVLAGHAGAVAATAGIFLPAFAFVA